MSRTAWLTEQEEPVRWPMLRTFIPFAIAALVSWPAQSQDRANAMLVLDASGSMWGQIDGVAKITIAQDVVSDLLDGLPQEQSLGLTAYGHRVSGNCADIEILVLPSRGSKEAIRTAVNGIKPKGKTPLSDAVLIAADTLGFTGAPATVILVTDGVETCDRDPCALARSLEAAGVDFTAHVIGFDVAAVDRPQLECLASETGGEFLTADSASELAEALTTVAQTAPAPPPAPDPLPVPEREMIRAQFDARDSNGLIFAALEWTLYGPDGPVVEARIQNQLLVDLERDREYRVVARKPETGETAELTFKATGEGFTFTRGLVFP